jgi:hypothetical protein
MGHRAPVPPPRAGGRSFIVVAEAKSRSRMPDALSVGVRWRMAARGCGGARVLKLN